MNTRSRSVASPKAPWLARSTARSMLAAPARSDARGQSPCGNWPRPRRAGRLLQQLTEHGRRLPAVLRVAGRDGRLQLGPGRVQVVFAGRDAPQADGRVGRPLPVPAADGPFQEGARQDELVPLHELFTEHAQRAGGEVRVAGVGYLGEEHAAALEVALVGQERAEADLGLRDDGGIAAEQRALEVLLGRLDVAVPCQQDAEVRLCERLDGRVAAATAASSRTRARSRSPSVTSRPPRLASARA